MANYLIRRIIYSIIILIFSASLIFIIVHAAPGSPFGRMFNEMLELHPNLNIPESHVERLNALLGLDQPLHIQFGMWLRSVFSGNLGISWSVATGQPVLDIILTRLPYTLLLMGATTMFAFLIALVAGVYSATHLYSEGDFIITATSYLGSAMPAYWVGVMMVAIFTSTLNWLPYGDVSSQVFRSQGDIITLIQRVLTLGLTQQQIAGLEGAILVDGLKHLIMPVFVLMLWPTARWTRTLRASMLEVLNQDYVRTARAKGVSQRAVVFKHCLRNAMIPLVTIMALDIPALFTGAFIVESIFNWPGIGRLFMESLRVVDWPMLTGIVIFTAFLIVIFNLVADLFYPIIDPRIKYT